MRSEREKKYILKGEDNGSVAAVKMFNFVPFLFNNFLQLKTRPVTLTEEGRGMKVAVVLRNEVFVVIEICGLLISSFLLFTN